MASRARGSPHRSTMPSLDMPGVVDEAVCVQPPSLVGRNPESPTTGFGGALSEASTTASSCREQTTTPSSMLALRTQPTLSTLEDEPELTNSGSVSETRKVWQTCTSTVLKAAGRTSGADSGNLVNQVTTLMQALQEHFDRKLESAVHDIKQSFESSQHSIEGSSCGWQRFDTPGSEEEEARKRTSRVQTGDGRDNDKFETSQLGGSISQTRGLQLPRDVMSHMQSSGYSMEEIQKAQEKHLLGVLRERRWKLRRKRRSHAARDSNFASPLPHIESEDSNSPPHVMDVIETSTVEEEDTPAIRPLSMLILSFWGIFPWSQSSPRRRMLSVFYQTLVFLLALCAALLQMRDTIGRLRTDLSWKIESVGYLIVAMGASLGLIQVQRLATISEIAGVLATEGSEKRLFWGCLSYNDVGAVLNLMAVALIMATSLVLPHTQRDSNCEALVRVLFLKALLCSVIFFVFLVAQAMQLTAEGFCRGFMRKPHFGEAIEFWGSIQVMLRKLCNDLAAALFTLVLTAIGIIATVIFESRGNEEKLDVLYRSLPLLVLPIYVLTTISQAADVTETCMRVPPLINSLNFGVQLDVDRLYLVHYIVHSGAGFHFNKVRLTGSMVTKAAYVLGLLLLSFLTGAGGNAQ